MQYEPLASLLRPKSLDDYVGQEHLVGSDGPIRRLCESKQVCSMILWGPPGCGKTSMVSLLENQWGLSVSKLSAITSGVKDIKALVPSAKFFEARHTQNKLFESNDSSEPSLTRLVFVDEIHRFNKAQQDAFLPLVENGDITLIGASTENPAFSINSALLSRMRVFTLKKLGSDALSNLFDKALIQADSGKYKNTKVDQLAKDYLIEMANGDARRLLTHVEVSLNLLTNECLTKQIVEQACGEIIADYDKSGDHYYDILSAFHKSIRGSSVDGGLFWLARCLQASSDISPICRRLLAIASEDIGNADPKALGLCVDAWDVYHRVGPAEGERAIAQAVVYCALAPKSNAVYLAFSQAKALAKKYVNTSVPLHLRNSTSSITKELGHGKDYDYAHNNEHAYSVSQEYLPEEVSENNFYQPNDRGFEKQLQAKIDFLKSLSKT